MDKSYLNNLQKTNFKGIEDITLPRELMDHIAAWKNREGNLVMVLHKVQEHYGYIPIPAAVKVAKELNIHLAKIYGVITFYHFFKLEKPGKHQVSVCLGTACYLKGAQDICDEITKILDVELGQTTEDGIFSWETVRCIGCCSLAPVMTIDHKVYGNLKKEDLPGIFAQYTENKTN